MTQAAAQVVRRKIVVDAPIEQAFATTPAVGICIHCGAAVCAGCARLAERSVPQPATVGNPPRGQTRAVSCASCDAVLDHHHGAAVALTSVMS